MNKKTIKGISLLKNSEYRRKILNALIEEKYLTPSEISEKTKIRLNHISNSLKTLRDNELVICLNDKEKRGRLYKITELGKKIIDELKL